MTATGRWSLNARDFNLRHGSGKSVYDPHATATLFLADAYTFRSCPHCSATRFDFVGLPIERLGPLVILVEDPDAGIGYEKK